MSALSVRVSSPQKSSNCLFPTALILSIPSTSYARLNTAVCPSSLRCGRLRAHRPTAYNFSSRPIRVSRILSTKI
ncbi:hypothetical protein L228DRAFT_249569, partial [Xylona heveae TC161]